MNTLREPLYVLRELWDIRFHAELGSTPLARCCASGSSRRSRVTITLAAITSYVIYGLRREVRRAQQLGQYALEEKLGEGGMGVVYRSTCP